MLVAVYDSEWFRLCQLFGSWSWARLVRAQLDPYRFCGQFAVGQKIKQMGNLFSCAQHQKANAVIVGTRGSSHAGKIGAVIKVDSVKDSVNPLSMLSTTSLDNQNQETNLNWTEYNRTKNRHNKWKPPHLLEGTKRSCLTFTTSEASLSLSMASTSFTLKLKWCLWKKRLCDVS